MVSGSEIYAGLGAFKTMLDIAQTFRDLSDATARKAAVIELQEKIISAQSAQAMLIQRVSELEAEMARMEKWETEKQRYQLKSLPPGVFVYALKPEKADGEPHHYICQNCYESGKKSHLHGSGNDYGAETFECRRCGSSFHVGKFNSPPFQRDYDPFV